MHPHLVGAAGLLAALQLSGCATGPYYQMMPTPLIYLPPHGQPVFSMAKQTQRSPDLDLLYITDRAPETAPDSTLPYGEERAKRIFFGSVQVRVVPPLDVETLSEQSQLAKRTREVDLELGKVHQLGAFPQEPYTVLKTPNGTLLRDRAELAHYDEAKDELMRGNRSHPPRCDAGQIGASVTE
jgi:hypothetical protein